MITERRQTLKRAILTLLACLLFAGLTACSASAITLIDDQLNGTNQGIISSISYTPAGSGQAAVFSGGSEYVKYDKSLFATEGTIALHVKVAGTRNMTILDSGGDFMLRPTSANTLQFLVYDSAIRDFHYIAGTTVFDPDKWYDVAVSYGSQGMKLYVNGVAEGKFGSYGDTTLAWAGRAMYLGHCTAANINSFTGAIDWIRASNVQNDISLLPAPAEAPEPSALLALTSSLLAMAGYVSRRRR